MLMYDDKHESATKENICEEGPTRCVKAQALPAGSPSEYYLSDHDPLLFWWDYGHFVGFALSRWPRSTRRAVK